MNPIDYLKNKYNSFKLGREVIKVSYDNLKKKYDAKELYQNKSGSVSVTGADDLEKRVLDDIETRVQDCLKEKSKSDYVAVILGMISRPMKVISISNIVENARKSSK